MTSLDMDTLENTMVAFLKIVVISLKTDHLGIFLFDFFEEHRVLT